MGESQPLKPQIRRCRNALIAGPTRRFAHLFLLPVVLVSCPRRGHNRLVVIRP
jgi:hypothetical protein